MENYNFTSTDYKNALWGKDIYTSKGLMARADILSDVFPEISKEFHNLVKKMDEYRKHYPIAMQINIMYFDQKLFADWVEEVFSIYRQAVKTIKAVRSYEPRTWEARKIQNKDIVALALSGAYPPYSAQIPFDDIGHIIFISIDLELGFSLEESVYGIITDYIHGNIPEYKKMDRNELFKAVELTAFKYIIEDSKDVFSSILSNLSFFNKYI